jgi:hypothetical protein
VKCLEAKMIPLYIDNVEDWKCLIDTLKITGSELLHIFLNDKENYMLRLKSILEAKNVKDWCFLDT